MIKLYNTLTRQKETFVPQVPGKVSMYVCGPTVYNYIHIGNARSTVAFDTIRRYLEFRGYDVDYVSNFTDVDDKIIAAAAERHEEPVEVADYFIDAFFEDVNALNVKPATSNPRVMDNMPDIIEFITDLIEKGYAYEAEGDVYFRTEAFEDYGKLSRMTISELKAGASNRLDDEEAAKKESSVDFALWKAAKPGEISWDSPWGQGRPGWHIECSVMATKHLGDTIDIHGGGQDLTFPHHENEIAQSEAKTGHTFAKYWLHNGFVTMDDEKMSKSLGNFKLVRDLCEEVDPQAIRFFLATAHYRHPLSFSKAAIHEAKTHLQRIKTAFRNAAHRLQELGGWDGAGEEATIVEETVAQSWAQLREDFTDAMDDDFQAQNAIAVVYEMIGVLNRYLNEEAVSAETIVALTEQLREHLAVFGVLDLELETPELLDEEIQSLIDERETARQEKDFARADEIRDDLAAQGIILEDTRSGVRFHREDTSDD